jgi:pantoate--beta-alanine ligase
MQIFTQIAQIKAYLRAEQKNGKTIGFVPTMGYLHEGHLSLIRRAADENDITVVSIFVNPAQFVQGDDFGKYPRDLDGDIHLSQEAGANVVFAPDNSVIYPEGYKTNVEVKEITSVLCGASRPGHFTGVTTVVAKLFNIIHPERAYFGQKDAQQVVVIQQMARDLDMDVRIVICPIIREEDGLAMSSRNVYLSLEERKQANVLFQSLIMARDLAFNGERDVSFIKSTIEKMILEKPLAKIDYISIVDASTLKDVPQIESSVLIALAVKFGATRLIDNIIVEV